MLQSLESLLKPDVEDADDEQTYRPQRFRLSLPDDREALEELFRAKRGIRVYDTLVTQLRDLIRTRQPGRKLVPQELNLRVSQHLGGSSVEEYGTWFYYPWSARLVHLLDEPEFVELRTNRNHYKITPQEQAKLSRKRIGVVGLSVGQSVALTLALERSFGELRLADFDTLDLSNLNRVRAGTHNLNLPKVHITAREVAEIDPYLRVVCFPNGVTETNCDTFLLGNSRLDIVIEECDSIDIKILLRHRARLHRIPVVMETCDRGMMDVERFDLELDRAVFHGLIGETGLASLRALTTEQKIPYVMQILGVHTLSPRLGASLIEVDQSISTWPQLASSVAHGGAAAADVVRRICLGDPVRSGRYYIDLAALIPSGESSSPIYLEEKESVGRPPALQLRDMLPAIGHSSRLHAPGGIELTPQMVRQLVADATAAPSGGNCQPWKWLSDGEYLYLFHDLSRSYCPYDPECRGGLVALGASSENLVLSAHAAGLQVVSDLFPCREIPQLVARFRFRSDLDDAVEAHWRGELYSMVRIRRTNRKLCPRRPLRAADLDILTAAVRSIHGAHVRWLATDEELEECGALLGMSDRLTFLTESWNRFLVNEIRWTPEEAEATRDGISLQSLELSAADQAGFQLCRDWHALKVVRSLHGGGQNLEKASRKALASASVVGLITMPSKTEASYFWGGRAVERLWLAAAERRLALHPMTGLPYMLAQFQAGRVLDAETQDTLQGLQSGYQNLFPATDGSAQVFLFRLSYAEETTQRSLRRDLDDVLVIKRDSNPRHRFCAQP
jgi:molybdopterin/thiamine biosynthesis adenylyltransferase